MSGVVDNPATYKGPHKYTYNLQTGFPGPTLHKGGEIQVCPKNPGFPLQSCSGDGNETIIPTIKGGVWILGALIYFQFK